MFYQVLNIVRKVYWFIIRPKSVGAKALIVKKGQVLLVKHSYEKYFLFPGGKANKDESPEQALYRELQEELGVEVTNSNLFGVYKNDKEYKKDTISLFIITEYTGAPSVNSREISELRWFPLSTNDPELSPATKKRLTEFGAAKQTSNIW